MNERIKLLAGQAGFRANPDIYDRNQSFDISKFADLIVRETLNEMGKFGDDQSNNPTWYKSMEAVEKHFGVER